MSRKLELVREEKLFRLLPGRRESGRLEASGVALVDDKTALVVFDNLNQVARIDLSLKRRASNRLLPAPSLGSGFEDIAIDHRYGRAFCLIELQAPTDALSDETTINNSAADVWDPIKRDHDAVAMRKLQDISSLLPADWDVV